MTEKSESSGVRRIRTSEWIRLVREDRYRYSDKTGITATIRNLILEPGFRISFLMRTCAFTRGNPWTRFGVYHVFRILYHMISTRYGVFIDYTTPIQGGIYLPHPCSIIINRSCIIGKDCNLSQNNTIGVSNRGTRKGCPVIGDRVYIAPGVVIFGNISVGNDSAIGANAVVNTDIPAGKTFAGVPAKQVSDRGSEGYVNQCNSGPTDTSDEKC